MKTRIANKVEKLDIELLPSEKDTKKIDIWLEQQYFRTVDPKLWKKHFHSLARQKTKEDFLAFFELQEGKLAKLFIYKQLAKRSYTSKQLEEKLKQKEIATKAYAPVLDECVRRGYINDQDTFLSIIAMYKRKNKGPKYIEQVLMHQHGVANETARLLIAKEYSMDEEMAILTNLLDKKQYKIVASKDKAKVYRSLLQKGFSPEIVRNKIDQVLYRNGVDC